MTYATMTDLLDLDPDALPLNVCRAVRSFRTIWPEYDDFDDVEILIKNTLSDLFHLCLLLGLDARPIIDKAADQALVEIEEDGGEPQHNQIARMIRSIVAGE